MIDSIEARVPPVIWTLLAIGLVVGTAAVLDERLVPNGIGSALSLVIGVFGAVVIMSAVAGFGQARTSVDPHTVSKASTLVTSGVYRVTRNPMYLGMLCFIIAAGLRQGSLLATALGAGSYVVVLTRVQIIPEERFLAEHFGEAYTTFARSVRRWL